MLSTDGSPRAQCKDSEGADSCVEGKTLRVSFMKLCLTDSPHSFTFLNIFESFIAQNERYSSPYLSLYPRQPTLRRHPSFLTLQTLHFFSRAKRHDKIRLVHTQRNPNGLYIQCCPEFRILPAISLLSLTFDIHWTQVRRKRSATTSAHKCRSCGRAQSTLGFLPDGRCLSTF